MPRFTTWTTNNCSEGVRELLLENRMSVIMYCELQLAFDDYMMIYGNHAHPALWVAYDMTLFWQREGQMSQDGTAAGIPGPDQHRILKILASGSRVGISYVSNIKSNY